MSPSQAAQALTMVLLLSSRDEAREGANLPHDERWLVRVLIFAVCQTLPGAPLAARKIRYPPAAAAAAASAALGPQRPGPQLARQTNAGQHQKRRYQRQSPPQG